VNMKPRRKPPQRSALGMILFHSIRNSGEAMAGDKFALRCRIQAAPCLGSIVDARAPAGPQQGPWI